MQSNTKETPEITFQKQIDYISNRWWFLTIAIIIGGLFGWFTHFVKPPIFQAKASLVVTMDFSQTGDLSAYNLDQAVGAIQYIFYSREVIQNVVVLAQQDGVDIDILTFSKSIRMERADQTWYLIVQDENLDRAGYLVNLWGERGYQELVRARLHALQAGFLKSQVVALRNCPMDLGTPMTIPAVCFQLYSHLPISEEDFLNLVQQELILSKGINQDLIFSKPELVESSLDPVIFNRNWLVFAGMLLGILIGIAVLVNQSRFSK